MHLFYRLLSSLILSTILFTSSFAGKPTTLTVMTFNVENGGAQVDFNKTVEAIRISGADVVGLQEIYGNIHKLAKALHWKYVNTAQNIISRFPLREPANAKHKYLFIEVMPGAMVAMANIHLPDEPYGPTMLSEGATVPAVLANERKVRLPSALAFIKMLSSLAKKGMPVFLTGDFNSPSNLDWTAQAINVAPHQGAVVPWVVTKTATDFGLQDSFRVIHSDPAKTLGYTWPAGRPFLRNTIDNYNPTDKDLPDRIDFIFFGGNAHALQSQVIAEGGNKHAELHVSPWPSDHAAVVSKFEVVPVKL